MKSKPAHILMTFDCGAVDEDTLQTLKLLSDDADVEVTGLYVEDEDLVTAASLPVFVEVSASGRVSKLDVQTISAQLAGQAERVRQRFEESARRQKIKFSFRTARGRVVDTLIQAAAGSDMVVINRSRRTTGLRSRHGRQFAPLLDRQHNLLFVNEPWRSGRSVVVLCETPQHSARAIRVAQRIAAADELELLIAQPPGQQELELPEGARSLVLPEWTEAAIVRLCEAEDARLLVLSAAAHLEWRTLLLGLLDRLSCSFLRLE